MKQTTQIYLGDERPTLITLFYATRVRPQPSKLTALSIFSGLKVI